MVVRDESESASEPAVLVERRGRTMVATINRPASRNAINRDVWRGIGRALEECELDDDVWAFVLTGAGDKSFCSGADLKAIARGDGIIPEDPVEAGWGFAGYVSHPISKPTVAAVNGIALGGGTELCLASDLVVAATSAQFGLPEVRRGRIAGAGGAFRLPQQLPRKIAMEMLLTGVPISADQALAWCLINRVVDQENVLDTALELADKILQGAPLAVQASKRIALGIVDGQISADDVGWDASRREGRIILASADAHEGAVSFAEKRPPLWLGR
jgi:crotonobetainyl-CoA hydratase